MGVFSEIYGFQGGLRNFEGFSEILRDFQGFKGFSGLLKDFQRSTEIL